jgi:hypothetical protein
MTASIGPIISGLAAVLFLLLSVLTFRARRADKRAVNLAAVRDTNVAALAWAYRVRALAAINGWEIPPIPKEMTPEYLAGKAEGDSNPELAQLAQLAGQLLPGHVQGGKVE